MKTDRSFAMLAVTSAGLGYLRPAPGTWGSLPPIAVGTALLALDASSAVFSVVMVITAIVFTAFCVAFGGRAESRFRRKDPSQVVADETAGQAVALLVFPVAHDHAYALLALSFFAFRGFDILKPPPANQLQAVRGGWGIVLDDLVAGAMALGVVWVAAAIL